LFAQLVTRTAKDIELLIDSLPSEDSSSDLQYTSLLKLEEENRDAGKSLEAVIHEGEATLKEIHAALHDIAKAQLEMQKLEAEVSH
jgi:mediator of RNA polymerase II transcription subunit 21